MSKTDGWALIIVSILGTLVCVISRSIFGLICFLWLLIGYVISYYINKKGGFD